MHPSKNGGITNARDLFYSKNNGVCGCNAMQPVTNYRSGFGAKGYIDAWKTGNAAWHFVGSYSVEIYPVENCTKLQFVITNNSSFTSFAYGVAPSWERSTFGPGGNMRQTYTWTEALQSGSCCVQ